MGPDRSFGLLRIFAQRLRVPSTLLAMLVNAFGNLPEVGRFDVLAFAQTHNG
jgi:hypothetical protein